MFSSVDALFHLGSPAAAQADRQFSGIQFMGKSDVQEDPAVVAPPVSPRQSTKPGGPFRALVLVAGIYASFIYWGYLQERVTSQTYPSAVPGAKPGKWHYMVTLNMFMAVASSLVALILHCTSGAQSLPPLMFVKAAFTNTIASPLGYLALRYINFPLLVLAKSCKLVPVMLVGSLVNQRRYSATEYMAVALITIGVMLFSLKPVYIESLMKGGLAADSQGGNALNELIGLSLAGCNLLVDGFTNAEQDRINAKYRISSHYMMLMINTWSVVFAMTYLASDFLLHKEASEAYQAWHFLVDYPSSRGDLAAFAFSNACGQMFIFAMIREYGSLWNVTVTITRKLFSILLSIFIFGHVLKWWQWVGCSAVFMGLGLSIVHGKSKAAAKAKEE